MEQDWLARGDTAEKERLKDWLESQSNVMRFWMDRLVERSDHATIARLEAHRKDLDQLIGSLR